MPKIYEYRGVEGLVYAEVTKDDNDEYMAGEVKELAGVAEIGRTTETSSEAHYYNNIPAVLVTSVGSDEVTLTVSAIPLDVLADITGQCYDKTTGAMIEGEREPKYFALGYIAKKTNGDLVYVWRYKGQFSIPDSTHKTEDDGTEANGQEITYTGISTTRKFTVDGKERHTKAINVDVGLGLVDVSDFFSKVTTPDELKPKALSTSGTAVKVTAKKEG